MRSADDGRGGGARALVRSRNAQVGRDMIRAERGGGCAVAQNSRLVDVVVPQTDAGNDISYSVEVDPEAAETAAVQALGAVEVDGEWYYLADEAGEVYELSSDDLVSYGAGLLDERGVDYSLWCSMSGKMVTAPSAAIMDALGME